jgi:hypothetical protein
VSATDPSREIQIQIQIRAVVGFGMMTEESGDSASPRNRRCWKIIDSRASRRGGLKSKCDVALGGSWWRLVAVAGFSVSFLLMVLYFHPWFIPIQAIKAALVVALRWLDWPTEAMVGA